MVFRNFLSFLCVAGAMAQPQAPSDTESISGAVRFAGGEPIAKVEISAGRGARREKQTTTDAQGRYTLAGLEPGEYRVTAFAKPAGGRGAGAFAMRRVTLIAGHDLTSIDFNLTARGRISGVVVDENKEPLPGITVLLVAREYSHGALAHVFAGAATTDDQGQYTLENVTPGRAYVVLAQKRTYRLNAISEAPDNPKLRKPASAATYYPGSPSVEGAQPLTLRPAEHREHVDIRLLRTPSYCAEGILQDANGPAALRFEISVQSPTSGASGTGAFYIASPGGSAGPDGRFRICELPPGDYELTAMSSAPGGPPPFYGSTIVTIVDRNVANIVVPTKPQQTVPVEVTWAGLAPNPPEAAELALDLRPLTRAYWRGETLHTKLSIPGQFTFEGILTGDYSVRVNGVPSGAYLQDVTYAGRNIRYEALRVGSAMGNATLRIVLARGGGEVAAKVTDEDGRPVADAHVVLWPASAISEAEVAAALVSGQTDQAGDWSSASLQPGKYYVVAASRAVDRSPESIGALWRARQSAAEVNVTAEKTVPVTPAMISVGQ
jgi:hypothetical protein